MNLLIYFLVKCTLRDFNNFGHIFNTEQILNKWVINRKKELYIRDRKKFIIQIWVLNKSGSDCSNISVKRSGNEDGGGTESKEFSS